jgi:hypothetical protein
MKTEKQISKKTERFKEKLEQLQRDMYWFAQMEIADSSAADAISRSAFELDEAVRILESELRGED